MYGKEENISAAEKLREQLRRDMLTDLDLGVGQSGGEGEEEEEGVVRFGVEDSRVERLRREREREGEGGEQGHKKEVDYKVVNWEEMVPGTKRVLSMDVSTLELPFPKKSRVINTAPPAFRSLQRT